MSKFIKNPSLHTTDEFKIQSSTSNKPVLSIESTSADNKGPELRLFKNANAGTGIVGNISWDGLNDNGDAVEYARISCTTQSIADNDERATMYLYVLPDEGFAEFNSAQLAMKLEGTSTADFTKATIYDTLHLGSSVQGATLQIGERADHLTTEAGMGQIWVRSSSPADLYYTDDTGQDVRITNNGSLAVSGGASKWAHSFGGYKTSNSSSTAYYFQYYPNNNVWNNSESSPGSVTYFDGYAAEWIAPADGTITQIDVFVRGYHSSSPDDVQFYVFKGTPSDSGSTSISLTQIAASGAVGIGAGDGGKVFRQRATISSSNTFSSGDGLWIMLKKESHSNSTSYYFSGTISGEFS
tara:strand:+ start:1048 stop:2109 length:1062 start_codon:yes stop_codon:yes gene_type:complete